MSSAPNDLPHPVTAQRPTSGLMWGFLLLVIAVALVARTAPQPRTVDDAFITFRYSRNVVDGNGFVYNRDSKVLGTTTPLYTLTMAGFGMFGDEYPWYALTVNAVADSISVALLFLIGAYVTGSRKAGLFVAAVWAIAPYTVTFAIGGMETSVHNLWMIAAWAAYLDRRRGGWVGAFVALGLLTRPDALLWAGPLMLHQLWTAWRERQPDDKLLDWSPWRDYVVGLVLGLPWTLFATFYFGSPFPHTVGTKSVVYHVDSSQAFVRLVQHYTTPFHQHEVLGAAAGVAVGLVFIVLSLFGWREAISRIPRSLPILSYPWLYFITFSVINPLIFRWYLTPPLPAYYLAIVCGVGVIISLLKPLKKVQWLSYATTGGAIVALLSILSAWELHPDHGPDRPAPKMAFHELELNYATMARRLVNKYGVEPDTLVGVSDIGAVGFYTNATILDTVGLVTPNLNRYYDLEAQEDMLADGANYVIPPEMIFERQPEYLVVMQDFITNGLQQDSRFAQYYVEIERIPTDYYGDAMLVFQYVGPDS